jgi:hypothetical protein
MGLRVEALEFERRLQNIDINSCLKTLHELGDTRLSESKYWHRQKLRLHHVLRRFAHRRNVIRIFFDDFWPDMDPRSCQMLDLFRRALSPLEIIPTFDPELCDISCYSCYGSLRSLSHTRHSHRILFLGENVRPSYTEFDLSLSFDKSSYCGRNIYLPLWILEIDWFNKQYVDRITNPLSLYTGSRLMSLTNRARKIVYIGNNNEPLRMSLISTLIEAGIDVDCYGSQTRPVMDKPKLLSEYIACICMENAVYPTYQTEKLLQSYPFVPNIFYWGASLPYCFSGKSHIYHLDNEAPHKTVLNAVNTIFNTSDEQYIQPPLLCAESTKKIFDNVTMTLRRKLVNFFG